MNITSLSQVAFANSPIIVRIDLLNDYPAFLPPEKDTKAFLKLTTFDLSSPGVRTNVNVYNLEKNRVSSNDKYVSFDISGFLKTNLVRKPNLPNQDFPVLQYNNLAMPVVSGGCLFYELEYWVTDGVATSVHTVKPNNVATLGYRWRNEKPPFYGSYAGSSEGFDYAIAPQKRYNDDIPFYAKQEFDFTHGTNVTSANFIKTTQVIPTVTDCAKETMLIIFLNRLGLWEYITTFGKISIDTDISRSVSDKSFRDNFNVNPDVSHSDNVKVQQVQQSYTVNTGILHESMNQLIEELIYSQKVYLVRFYGDKYTTAQIGVTVDSETITVDNETITVDSETVTLDDVGYFSTYTQVPVTITDSNFVKKTQINDRRDISYFIKFKETASKIKN